MWTSKVWFNRPSFEKNFVSHPPNRDTKSQVTRETPITNHQRSCTKQQSEKEATFPKKEECNVDRRVQVLTIVVKQPTSSHLVQPIAWRRPDLGLSSTNDVCRTRTWYHAPRQRDEVSMPRLKHRNHKTQTWTSKAWFNQLSFEKNCPLKNVLEKIKNV